MKKIIFTFFSILLLFLPTIISAQQSPYYTGDGGRGMRLTVLELAERNLESSQEYLTALVQGQLVMNISKYSAIDVMDRTSLDRVIADNMDSAIYKDDNLDVLWVGSLTQARYVMSGEIIRTSAGYSLSINMIDNNTASTIARHSGTYTLAQLENQNAVQRAIIDIFPQLGITLTQRAIDELSEYVNENNRNAQIALAQGITAQKQGTEVAALSYYFQAVTLDPQLFEAVSRSAIISANISSGNIIADVRNDIVWRRAWIERLTETEEYFRQILTESKSPFVIFYATYPQLSPVNYQTETLDINFDINLRSNDEWFNTIIGSAERVAQSIYDGLQATGRATEWGLANWPLTPITAQSPFNREWKTDIIISYELVNDRNTMIGRGSYRTSGAFSILFAENRKFGTVLRRDAFGKIDFKSVKVDEMTDNLTIRITSVNGVRPDEAQIPIFAIPQATFDLNRQTNRWNTDRESAEKDRQRQEAEQERQRQETEQEQQRQQAERERQRQQAEQERQRQQAEQERQRQQAEQERQRQQAERERQKQEAEQEKQRKKAERELQRQLARQDQSIKDHKFHIAAGYNLSYLNGDKGKHTDSKSGYHLEASYRFWTSDFIHYPSLRYINKGFSFEGISASYHQIELAYKAGYLVNDFIIPNIGISSSHILLARMDGQSLSRNLSNMALIIPVGVDFIIKQRYTAGAEFDIGLGSISEQGSQFNTFLIKAGYLF